MSKTTRKMILKNSISLYAITVSTTNKNIIEIILWFMSLLLVGCWNVIIMEDDYLCKLK